MPFHRELAAMVGLANALSRIFGLSKSKTTRKVVSWRSLGDDAPEQHEVENLSAGKRMSLARYESHRLEM
jgi:hypothetical protein